MSKRVRGSEAVEQRDSELDIQADEGLVRCRVLQRTLHGGKSQGEAVADRTSQYGSSARAKIKVHQRNIQRYQITLEENNKLYIQLSDQRKVLEEHEKEKKNFNSKIISIVSENSYNKRKY